MKAWNRFWFEPRSTSTLAVLRIAVGLITVGWTLSVAPDVRSFFSRSGVVPRQPPFGSWYGVLGWARGDGAVWVLYGLLLVAAVCLTLGLGTRVAAVVAFVALLSFERRNPWVLNSGDLLLRHLLLFLALSPAGAALSLDARLRGRDPRAFPLRALWPVRLVQVQLSVLYLATVWAKVQGTTWNDGTAISYALRLRDLSRFVVPAGALHSLTFVNLLTYAVLGIELALGILVWNRRLRPWVLVLGILLHIGIELTVMVGFFSFSLFAAYIAWVPPETMDRWLHRLLASLRSYSTPKSREVEGMGEAVTPTP